MRCQVVLEPSRLEHLGLDDVVEAELSDGDQDGTTGRPVRAVEELAEAFLAGHAGQTVNGVLVAEKREKVECIASPSNLKASKYGLPFQLMQ